MSEVTTAPDIAALDIPMDVWTQPFWDAAQRGVLLLPQCTDCKRFRWPPGPFCPHCHSQAVTWQPPGPPRIYSYTIVRHIAEGEPVRVVAPALVQFPEADGVRMLGAIVDTPVDLLNIGSELVVGWSAAANGMVPVFRVARR